MARSLVRFGAEDADGHDLVCFPGAGEWASRFAPWRACLPLRVGLIGVERPARGHRISEPASDRLAQVAREIADDLAAVRRRPIVLLGHSVGSLVAHAVASLLEAEGAPALLVVSCHGRSPAIDRAIPWSDVSDDALLEDLSAMHRATEWILRREDFREVFLPALRADLGLYVRDREEWFAPVETPILALGGARDPLVPPADVHRWRELARGSYLTTVIDGDHFAPFEAPGPFLDRLGLLASAVVDLGGRS